MTPQQYSGPSAADSKGSLPSWGYRPLVPPVLDLLENITASPLLSFVVFYFLHLLREKQQDNVREENADRPFVSACQKTK